MLHSRFILIAALALLITVNGFHSYTRWIKNSIKLYADVPNNKETPPEDLAKMLQMIMNAVDSNKTDDLVKAGFVVKTRSTQEILEANLNNAQLIENVVGRPDEDQIEIMKAMALFEEQEVDEINDDINLIGYDDIQEDNISIENKDDNFISVDDLELIKYELQQDLNISILFIMMNLLNLILILL